MNHCFGSFYPRSFLVLSVCCGIAGGTLNTLGAETNQATAANADSIASPASPVDANGNPSTNSNSSVVVLDPAQVTRQMIESLHKEIETQVARHTGAITSTLLQIEPALERIRQQQAEASNSANRTILIAAGLFALAGFFGLGFLTMASVRAMGRFTEVAVNVATRKQLPGPGETTGASADPTFKPVVSATLEQASARFQGALEQLEQRILELEHSAHPSAIPSQPAASHATANRNPREPKSNGNPRAVEATLAAGSSASASASAPAAPGPGAAPGAGPSHAEIQLGKGQALLNLEQPAQALECFESALAEEPNNTDALLRKGMTLEKLEQWDRALECYDRAIELDGSLTVAYLYKGGICNRLEKHDEALRSYERALQSERQRAISEL